MIGLVPVGFQRVAERYAYLPSLGLAVPIAFAAAELAERSRVPSALRGAIAGAVLALLALLTTLQISSWRDGRTLFEHALAVTRDNFVMHAFLANELADAGRSGETIAEFREALRIRPDFPHAHCALGVMFEERREPARPRRRSRPGGPSLRAGAGARAEPSRSPARAGDRARPGEAARRALSLEALRATCTRSR